jgi:translocator assembly and maintenance protein 41
MGNGYNWLGDLLQYACSSWIISTSSFSIVQMVRKQEKEPTCCLCSCFQVIKYGVVSVDTLKRDLRDWDTMYLAGRLQKPVNTLISNDGIVSAQKLNIDSAMKTALLLCPNTFNVTELLKIICSLSYIGDIRLGFAEDSKKVERIVRGMWVCAHVLCVTSHGHLCVSGSHDRMFEMYTNGMEKALEASMITLLGPSQSLVNTRSVFRNTLSVSDRTLLYASLPIHVLRNIVKLKRGDKLPKSAKLLTTSEQADMTHRLDLGKYLASSPYGALALQRAMASIVRRSSFRQGLLGIISAGPFRSAKYLSAKVAKYMASR